MFRLAVLSSLVALPTFTLPAAPPAVSANVELRGDFENCRQRFERERDGHVAFLGGSITEMDGYRPMLVEWLTRRFPETQFTFTNAGIASTCSTTGAFRLERDVFAPREGVPHGGVDLLFVEFAVNDDQDAGHTREAAVRGMEGILRHLRREHPRADVVVTYFVNPGMLETIQAGDVPLSIAAHETVASHYGVSTVNLAKEVADRIARGDLTWEVYGGTHPKPPGNRIAADLCSGLLEQAWSHEPVEEPKPRAMPKPFDGKSYDAGKLLPPDAIEPTAGWTVAEPRWRTIRGSLRARFAGRKLAIAEAPGPVARLTFVGRGVGAYVLAGPDAGIAEVRVDGGDWREVDLYHHFSKGLHYPRTVMFATNLEPGEHVLEIRPAATRNEASTGHVIRVVGWAVNGPG